MSPQTDLAAASGVLFALFAFLGVRVSHRPLGRLDAMGVFFRGQATRVARIFTISGRSRGLTAACALAVAAFLLARQPVWIPVAMILSQTLSQGAIESLKPAFGRTRPDYWLVGLDAGHSYPSGHSATGVIFFIGWAVVAWLAPWHSPVPRDVTAAALCAWGLGVMWSRLALGAHYLTDVIGGIVFGSAWVCGCAALLLRFWGFVEVHGGYLR